MKTRFNTENAESTEKYMIEDEPVLPFDKITERIIGCAIEIHRALGPGLLESAYEQCLAYELNQSGLTFVRQAAIPVRYKAVQLDCGFRADLIVEDQVIVELKSVEKLAPIHEAQLLTYLQLSGLPAGLILNFNTRVLKDGIVRKINTVPMLQALRSLRTPTT